MNRSLDLTKIAIKNGQLGIERKAEGPLSEREQEFVTRVGRVIDDPRTVRMTVTGPDPEFPIGRFADGALDSDDFEVLANAQPGPKNGLPASPFVPTTAEALGHEVVEQFDKQMNGVSERETAHDTAVKTDDAVNGTVRLWGAVTNPQRQQTKNYNEVYQRRIGSKLWQFRYLQSPNSPRLTIP